MLLLTHGPLWEVMIGMEYLLNFFEERKLMFFQPNGTTKALQSLRVLSNHEYDFPRIPLLLGRLTPCTYVYFAN